MPDNKPILIAVTSAAVLVASFAWAGTLDDVRSRGTLVCGVSEGLPGFSDRDASGDWSGFDADFCRAVAVAALADPDAVEFVPLSAADRFDALRNGSIDVLSRNSTWNMERDVGLGIDFAGVAYYDGQGFLSRAEYGLTSALELFSARICVVAETSSEINAAAYFADQNIDVTLVPFEERAQARAAYAEESCDALTADRSALAAERSRMEDPDAHVILREVVSKEPLGPVTREDDPAWTDLVRWTLYGLINAEEVGLTAATLDPSSSDGKAGVEQAIALGAVAAAPLDLREDWLVKVISEVGNYGEIFERNLGEETPLGINRGINAPWNAGGILYAPPM